MGNLTRDPELKYTPQGTAVCNFSLAVNRSFKGADGNQKKEVIFVPIVIWGKIGENCSKYLSKGSAAHVQGRLSIREYEKDGQKRRITEIIATWVEFLGSPRRDDNGSGNGGSNGDHYQSEGGGYDSGPDDEVPF
jgi:single-strand DNA-binding protein